MFLTEAIDDYAGYARSELGHSTSTIFTCRSRQRHFATWLSENGTPNPQVEEVTANHIRRYSYALSSRGLRPRSIRGALNALRALYGYLVQMGATTHDPSQEVKLPKKAAATRRLVSDEDLVKLLAASEQQRTEFRVLRDKAILSVLIFCGLRRQEILDLTVHCVNLEGKLILVQQGKGQKSRSIYPCEECLTAVREWLEFRTSLKCKNDWLFVDGIERAAKRARA